MQVLHHDGHRRGVLASVAVNTTAAASATGTPGSGAGSTASAQSTSTTSPVGIGAVATPKQQLSAVPAGEKLTAFTTASASADGRTLYVELESMGGACGQYDVVLQQSSTTVRWAWCTCPPAATSARSSSARSG